MNSSRPARPREEPIASPREQQLREALIAAQQFIYPEVHRGPDSDGWQTTVELVERALAAAPAPPPQEPSCICGEADGMAVYSEDCPNEYHRERAVRAVFKSPRPATPQQESAKQNESRSPDGDGPHIFQDDLETGQCLVCGKAGGVHEPPAKRQQRTQP